MKKSTIVLIIVCVASLVLSVILFVAAAISLKGFGVRWAKDFFRDNAIEWDGSNWNIDWENDEENGDVSVKMPFIRIETDEDGERIEIPFIDISVNDGKGSISIGKNDDVAETTLPDDTNETSATDSGEN
ncbi:MAG: hypothetical protein JW817_05590 [Clostridiales bacterium]|nr:hypothetical protein [Clostridiales bacterium]